MTTKTVIDIDSAGEITFNSDKVKASGYYGFTNGDHSISLKLTEFTGRIYVQASLVFDPNEEDWFNISITDNIYDQYPKPTDPPFNGTIFYNFEVNAVWIRIRIDREYLNNPVIEIVGSVEKAYLNY